MASVHVASGIFAGARSPGTVHSGRERIPSDAPERAENGLQEFGI